MPAKVEAGRPASKGGSHHRNNRSVVKDPLRYKTVPCANFERNGECPYGRKCQFAHGAAEMRRRPANCPADAPAPAAAKTLRSPPSHGKDVAAKKSPQRLSSSVSSHERMTRKPETHHSIIGGHSSCSACSSVVGSSLPSNMPSPRLPSASSLLHSPPSVSFGPMTVSPVLTAISPLLLPPPLQHSAGSGSSSREDCTPTLPPSSGVDWFRCNSRTGKVEVNTEHSADDEQLHGAVLDAADTLEHLRLPSSVPTVAKQLSHETQTVRRSISMLWADDPVGQAATVEAVAEATCRAAAAAAASTATSVASAAASTARLPPALSGSSHEENVREGAAQAQPSARGGCQQCGLGSTASSAAPQQPTHPWQPLISTWSSPPLEAAPYLSGVAPIGKTSEIEKENREALSSKLQISEILSPHIISHHISREQMRERMREQMREQMLPPLSIGNDISRDLSFGAGGMCVRNAIDHLFEDDCGALTSS